jgi:hypothetical protein
LEPTRWLAVAAIVGVVGVEYGGWWLLTFLTGRAEISDAGHRYFRVGHAHAGVLLILALVYARYLADTNMSTGLQWASGTVLLLGVMAQSGGFFVHMMSSEPGSSVTGSRLTRGGALLMGAALIALAVALATT